MKQLYLFLFLFLLAFQVLAQTDPAAAARIGKQIQTIYKTSDWNDPVAAKKANAEIDKLSKQISGSPGMPFQIPGQPSKQGAKPTNTAYKGKTAATKENSIAIADRYFKRSYKALDAISKSQFDQDFAAAKKQNLNFESVRKLTSTGGTLLTLGNDHNVACVYLASAVKAMPGDTLSINNFGGYLRAIDSIQPSIPVLLYANNIFSGSPVILTQLGNSYFDLDDLTQAEFYYKEAIKYNPDFGQAHASLCDLYISMGRIREAIAELFAGVKNQGSTFMQASTSMENIKGQYASAPGGDDFESKEEFWGEVKKSSNPPAGGNPPGSETGKINMPKFPLCKSAEDWMLGGGYTTAATYYDQFGKELEAFRKRFKNVQDEKPEIPPDAVIRAYDNERFMIQSITECFFYESEKERTRFTKTSDKIKQSLSAEYDVFLDKLEKKTKSMMSCAEGCGNDKFCVDGCERSFCQEICPEVSKFNGHLEQVYNKYIEELVKYYQKQNEIFDNLYGFAEPWLGKIYSPYWSKICRYETKRVALSIVDNCYSAYAQPFNWPALSTCKKDCDSYFAPYGNIPDAVKNNDPEANDCPDWVKTKLPLGICDVSLTCESIEFGCSAGVAGSVKRNFKHKSTTMFVGVGLNGELGVISGGIKSGVTFTVKDNNEVEDVGSKTDVSVAVGVGAAKIGSTATGTCTVMTGCKSKVSFDVGYSKPK